jgi:uncharacterized protein YcaQ
MVRPMGTHSVPASVSLSAAEARRIALAAQGFAASRPAHPDRGHLRRMATRLGAIQIDSVNVLARAHYLPAWSRLGAYPMSTLDRLAYDGREMFEYPGHALCYLPSELHPAMRWRMARYAEDPRWLAFQARVERERPGYVAALVREITERGPLAPTELTDQGKREKVPTRYAETSIMWWSWSDGKDVLEWLFLGGRLAVAGRRAFERRYDLAERVIPAAILSLPTPPRDEAIRTLVGTAARALGVATAGDLAAYFKLPSAATRAGIRELVEEGVLQPVAVEGWAGPSYLHTCASERPVDARALVSPFDPLVWHRERAERMFGFHYRIEIYVPEARRQHGYYVLPFLFGDTLVARVDLKADRQRNVLMVPGAFLQPGADVARVTEGLAAELRAMAAWLGLDGIDAGQRGDLAAELARALDGS